MSTVLTIATADVRRLAGIDASDTSQDTAMAALISAEQIVHEYALDPGILGLAVGAGAGDGLLATLTLGVAEVMAGDYLQVTARAGSLSAIWLSGLHLTFAPAQLPGPLGSALTKQGLERLAPFTRAARSRTVAAAGANPDDFAPIPQLIASSSPPASVFDRPFRDAEPPNVWIGDGDSLTWEVPEP